MIVKNVQLAFLGEDRLAVMSQDDMSFPESGTARKRLHLTVDVFSLNSSDADNFSELRYETETADSRIAALPSGRMIASLSQQLILLDERLQVEATSSLNLVCAPQPQLADKEGYVVALFPASEDVAVVSVQPTVNRLVPTETARPLVLVLNARSTSDRADGAFPGHTRNCEGSSHVYGESRKQERFPKRRAVELLRYLVGGSRHLASARIDWPRGTGVSTTSNLQKLMRAFSVTEVINIFKSLCIIHLHPLSPMGESTFPHFAMLSSSRPTRDSFSAWAFCFPAAAL
jgi:hypothetical protein